MQSYIPKSISYLELEKTDWPEEIFIDGGIISRGDRLLIGADSKGGKSTLVNDLNREMLTAGNFLGFKVVKPLKILYMQAELRPRRLKERLIPNIGQIPSDKKELFRIWNTQNQVLLPENISDIEKEIDWFRPDILEIDPMINFHRFDENSASDMSKFFRCIDYLKDKFNFAVIIAHHFRKAGGKESKGLSLLDFIRGSSAMRGWADTTIAMEGRTESEYRELFFDTRNSDKDIKRIIKYNSKTKSFDWHDPIATIGTWLEQNMDGKELPAIEFYKFVSESYGHLFSHNKEKFLKVRTALQRAGITHERKDGTRHLISLRKP